MSDMPCWVFFYEHAGYDDNIDCLMVHRDMTLEDVNAMCNLDEAHDGPHEFVPQDQVVLRFTSVEEVPA